MFKGREKELYIILSLPSVIYLLTKRKNMVYSFSFLKSCVCDTQVTLFSFLLQIHTPKNVANLQIQSIIQSCYCRLLYCSLIPQATNRSFESAKSLSKLIGEKKALFKPFIFRQPSVCFSRQKRNLYT